MNNEQTKHSSWEFFLLRAARAISLTGPQYEKINGRYEQLETILSASDDPILQNAHILPQGSMRLKTTINPVANAPADLGTIDADAIVWLPNAKGVSADKVLEAIEKRFKEGSRVHEDIQPLRRGVRIVYADQSPGFHIDVTPARARSGNDETHGEGMLEVPDRQTGWKASSPIPYANWLHDASECQIILEHYEALNKSRAVADSATLDPLPGYLEYRSEDPLRASIKLLKRHRDEWAIRTNNAKSRPISAIITTLATHAWLNVANQSRQKPFTPLEAILEIVRTMPNFILRQGQEYMVCNPQDRDENFAEKWNRLGEGGTYQKAFYEWHESACEALALGLGSYSSVESFAKAVNESFGIGRSFVDDVNASIPANWTMPGRPSGMNRNAASMGALFGIAAGSAQSQDDTKPVGRLG